jgi:hypothetical protein
VTPRQFFLAHEHRTPVLEVQGLALAVVRTGTLPLGGELKGMKLGGTAVAKKDFARTNLGVYPVGWWRSVAHYLYIAVMKAHGERD